MNRNAETGTLLERIRKARAEHRTVERAGAEVDLENAYRIQAAFGEGQELKGYKLDVIEPAEQERVVPDACIYGRVYANMFLGSPVNLSRFIQPRLQPEIAVVLGGNVPPDAEPDEVYLSVGGIFLAIDFLDSVWEGYGVGLAGVVADNASGGGFLVGERLLDAPFEGKLSLYLDDALLIEEPLEASGNPEERLAWLAGKVDGLRAGQVVFLGPVAAALEARPGTLELRGPKDSTLIARVER